MYHHITAEDILREIQFKATKAGPGLSYDIDARTTSRSREVLNNETMEGLNNSSRRSEDELDGKSPLSPVASPLQTPDLGQEDFGSNITPARTSSRYTGITVQHCSPPPHSRRPGVKLAISLQTPGMAEQGQLFLLTAELKRYKRLREIKAKMDDTSQFAQLLEQAKRAIYEDKDYHMVMGRLHLRGKRTAWIPNCLAIGRIDGDKVCHVILFLDDEQYTIKLDNSLSPAQENLYLSAGQWGTIAHPNSHSPSLQALIQERFGK